jgi:hypothetical protein
MIIFVIALMIEADRVGTAKVGKFKQERRQLSDRGLAARLTLR